MLLSWSRLVLPDGRSVALEKAQATDDQGFAGLQDGVDRHWGQLAAASLVSLAISAAGELGRANDEDRLLEAVRRGLGGTASEAGEQVVGRSLSLQPTLSVRAGFPVRVLLVDDLVLPAWLAG